MKPNHTEATTITNQSGIYFDYNEVVLTNTMLNTLLTFPEPPRNRSHLASDYSFGILPCNNKIHLVLNYERIT